MSLALTAWLWLWLWLRIVTSDADVAVVAVQTASKLVESDTFKKIALLLLLLSLPARFFSSSQCALP